MGQAWQAATEICEINFTLLLFSLRILPNSIPSIANPDRACSEVLHMPLPQSSSDPQQESVPLVGNSPENNDTEHAASPSDASRLVKLTNTPYMIKMCQFHTFEFIIFYFHNCLY